MEVALKRLLNESEGKVLDKDVKEYFSNRPLFSLSKPKYACQASMLDGVYWVKPSNDWKEKDWFKDLVCKPEAKQGEPQSFPICFFHPLGFLGLPKFYGLSLFGKPQKDLRSHENKILIEFCKDKKLRDYQEICVKNTLEKLHEWGGATIIADCGAGKTAMSLFICSQLKVKTLVICNRLFLMEQWKSEISNWLPGSTIGWLQGSEETRQDYDIHKDIVVASIESLSRCLHKKEDLKTFNFVIVDEMHHLGAKTLSQVLPKLPARYILGVTATPDRADNLEHVLYWLAGPTSFVYKRIPEITGKASNVTIQIKNFKCRHINYEGKYMQLIKELEQNMKRHIEIINLVKELQKSRRKILIVTSSVSHGDTLFKEFEDSVFIHGGVRQEYVAFAKSKKCKIVVATYQYMEEGYDDPTLDTLVLSLPRSKIQQVIGRCERFHEGKLDPLVIDIVDSHYFFKGMYRKREKFYKERKFIIKREVEVEEQEEVQASSLMPEEPQQ
jgi:superfamily II DNA or RNA helicase